MAMMMCRDNAAGHPRAEALPPKEPDHRRLQNRGTTTRSSTKRTMLNRTDRALRSAPQEGHQWPNRT